MVFVEYAFDVFGVDGDRAYEMVLEWFGLIGARVMSKTGMEIRGEHGRGNFTLYTQVHSLKTVYVKLFPSESGGAVKTKIEVYFGSRANASIERRLRSAWGDRLIGRLKSLVAKYQGLTKRARESAKRLARVKVEEKPKLDKTEEKVLDLLVAYDRAATFPLKKLSEMTGEKIKQVRLAVARLLRLGLLSGHLEGNKYMRGVQYVTTCVLCNERHHNPEIYYQCPECFQYICESCMSVLPSNTCPRHPESAVEVVKMPLYCANCKVTVTNLEKNRNGTNCPNCEGAMVHLAERVT